MSEDRPKECSRATARWLRELVRHRTVSGNSSNLELLERVAELLSSLGFELRFTHSEDGRRANLLASLGGSEGGLLLSGHTDVVPVAGQAWTHAPFELTEEADRFYGRGSCDMKGFLAALLAMVERQGPQGLSHPLHIALTYDEEIGCVGVRGLLADLAHAGIRPAACIVGEPTCMLVVRAHKGRHAYRCHVRGRAAHSSLSGLGVNAAEAACALAAEVARQAEVLRSGERDEGFFVPYSTLAVCRLQAGHATNVIPEDAEFDFDLRYLPGTDPETVVAPLQARAARLESEMRARVETAEIRMERRTAVPALVPDEASTPLIQRALLAGATLGQPVAYTTEAGLYRVAGIPTVVCGPGDIAQAHAADEFILKSELALCEEFLTRLVGVSK